MAYTKILIDNPTCSRRFHVTYDDQAERVPRVELRCQFCNAVVFAEDNHPPAKMAREENLVKTSQLSDILVSDCNFADELSRKTIPEQKGIGPMYPEHATRK